jgi:hypothetical protein
VRLALVCELFVTDVLMHHHWNENKEGFYVHVFHFSSPLNRQGLLECGFCGSRLIRIASERYKTALSLVSLFPTAADETRHFAFGCSLEDFGRSIGAFVLTYMAA